MSACIKAKKLRVQKKRSSGQVQGRGQQKRGLQRQRLPVGMEGGRYEEATHKGYAGGEKTAGQESSSCSENTVCSVCKAWMKRQGRMETMKDMTKKISMVG